MKQKPTSVVRAQPPQAAATGMSARGAASRRRILEAALGVFRTRGYAATTVDDLCRAAGVTKGSFFLHFERKEWAALAAIEHWNAVTASLFAGAPYWQIDDARDRLLAYLDFRAQLAQGDLPEFTCLLGTLAQETFASHPALRAACGAGIEAHAQTLVPTIQSAFDDHAAGGHADAQSLARYTQAVLQGAFVLAKAAGEPGPVLDAIAHLRCYVELLLPLSTEGDTP